MSSNCGGGGLVPLKSATVLHRGQVCEEEISPPGERQPTTCSASGGPRDAGRWAGLPVVPLLRGVIAAGKTGASQ